MINALSDKTEIYGVSIRHMILRNQDLRQILILLKSNYSYVLSKEVVNLLKLKHYFTSTGIKHLSNRDLYARQVILKFNKRREYSQKITDYLNEKFKEDIELDYVQCDTLVELKFGL